MIGQQVGDYRILEQLGEGGMGMVYKGQHAAMGQIVAVKSLHNTLMHNQAAKDRFIREAQALARLNHPNIISLLNFINNEQGCFIVMEFAEGEDLEQKLQRMGLIPPEQCIPWFAEACRGLSFAHKQQIIHRDIKPSNIMVNTQGVTKLLDFGTAKLVDAQRLTQQGMTLGTVIYMSKEQLLGKPLDDRSDVYSLGVTLYECVTGQLPFYDEEERNLVLKIAKENPIPPSQHYPGIGKPLEDVILKAMDKDPNKRFQSAAEMEQTLMGLAGGAKPVAVPAAPTPAAAQASASAPAAPARPTPAAPAPASSGGGGGISMLFLLGVFIAIVGLVVGIPIAAFADQLVIGLVITLLLGLIGMSLAVVGLLNSSAKKGAAAAPGGKPCCPSCGRALLQGMTDCPFCNPQAAAPAATSTPAVTPAAASFSPGGTLNVNSAQAAGATYNAPSQVASATPGTALLQIIDGSDKGKQYQVAQNGRFTMGRAPSCTCTLNDPGVSGQHAAVAWANGVLFVEDTGSRNGVFVNNVKVNNRQNLKAGDLIVVGSTRLLVNLG